MNLQDLKRIPKSTRYKVFGYIRRLKRTLSLHLIPPLIMYTCLLLADDSDYFNIQYLPVQYQISDNQRTLTLRKRVYPTHRYYAFGTIQISNTSPVIATWTIRINKCDQKNGSINLGFIIPSTHFDKLYITNQGWIFTNEAEASFGSKTNLTPDSGFRTGDQVTIILDLYENEIKYKLNNQCEQLIISGTKAPNYKFYVNITATTNSISITEFSIRCKK